MSKRPRSMAVGFGTLLLVAVSGAAAGQAESAPAIEPGAFEALDQMGTYLRTLTSFEVEAQSTIDEVLLSGQKLQFSNTVQIRARRPDHAWIVVDSDRKQRE